MPSSANLSLGPGKLYVVDLLTPDITDHTTALSATVLAGEVGYTAEGSEISYSFGTDPVEVAEALDPLFNRTTSRSGSVTFAMAENTVRNLTFAFNGGKVTAYGTGASAGLKYEPPEPGFEVRRKIIWVAEDNTERWLLRQTFQTGDVTVARRKGAEYATLPVTFAIETPAAGGAPFAVFYAGSRAGGAVAAP